MKHNVKNCMYALADASVLRLNQYAEEKNFLDEKLNDLRNMLHKRTEEVILADKIRGIVESSKIINGGNQKLTLFYINLDQPAKNKLDRILKCQGAIGIGKENCNVLSKCGFDF